MGRKGQKFKQSGGDRGPRGEGYDKGYKGGENGDNENKNVDPGIMNINCTNTTQ